MATSGARASPGRRPIAPTSSAGPSSSGPGQAPGPGTGRAPGPRAPSPDRLSGAVDVCVDVPRLAVDKPFTYLLSEDAGAGTGSLVSVPFHGRALKGWILGPASSPPPSSGRLLSVRKVRSAVRFFDPSLLELFRWMSSRYLAPLSTVIERSYPPRVVSEEKGSFAEVVGGGAEVVGGYAEGVGAGAVDAATPAGRGRRGAPDGPAPPPEPSSVGTGAPPLVLGDLYRGVEDILEPGAVSWVRPLPSDEAALCVAAVTACLAVGRSAVVLVPEAEPLPGTASAVLEAFGGRAVGFLGGEARGRYRTWLRILRGEFEVVVGTRPGVFAPVPRLGLVWVSREVHPAHREERSPYYHVREVAAARARIEGAGCVLASLCPSVETAVGVAGGTVREVRAARQAERAAAPLVEATPPEAEDRSVRLGQLLKSASSAALVVSRRGYGVARVCRSCGQPATCAVCRGPIVAEEGRAHCRTCGAPGRCAHCGGTAFGVERGGTERVAEWAGRIAGRPVDLEREAGDPPVPGQGRLLVGTAAAVKDVGPVALDLVAILDPDRALARPGFHAGEQSLATWMEAAAWAGPRAGGARVLVQTRHPGHPALQALIRWEPGPFLLAEGRARAEAGMPPNHHLFRVHGSEGLEGHLRRAGATPVLSTTLEAGQVCLLAVPPERFEAFRTEVLRLVGEGVVTRVEAEPEL